MSCYGAMHVAGHGQETNSRYYFPVYLALFSQAQIPMSNCSSIYIIHITKKLKEGTTYTSKHHKLRKIAELELATHCSDTIKRAVCRALLQTHVHGVLHERFRAVVLQQYMADKSLQPLKA